MNCDLYESTCVLLGYKFENALGKKNSECERVIVRGMESKTGLEQEGVSETRRGKKKAVRIASNNP